MQSTFSSKYKNSTIGIKFCGMIYFEQRKDFNSRAYDLFAKVIVRNLEKILSQIFSDIVSLIRIV
jgi:hypothetical protein